MHFNVNVSSRVRLLILVHTADWDAVGVLITINGTNYLYSRI